MMESIVEEKLVSFKTLEYSTHLVRSFRTFSAGHPEIQCNNSGCQCSPL